MSCSVPHGPFNPQLSAWLIQIDKNFAAILGNSERLARCEALPQFAASREEWFCAWRILLNQHGFRIAAEASADMDGCKEYVIERLNQPRRDQQSVILKNTAQVIWNAAKEGDVDFFVRMAAAFRNADRHRPKEQPLGGYIMQYWFSGLLWLMDNEAGSLALLAYLRASPKMGRSAVPIDAYKKARSRLGLSGYKTFTTRPPILAYLPKLRAYRYAPSWETKLEPNVSSC
jgi:hypothetical protein